MGGAVASLRQNCTCEICPCPDITAYWTPPPSWPRRLLCENRFFTYSCSRTGWLLVGTILLTYFLVMDVLLFTRFQNVNLVLDSKGGKLDEIYTPITHLSIKGILNDHPSQFFIAPSTEYFNTITHFSSIFSFITPNMISFSHLICGFIAGKFLASENLQDRRIGVFLYEYRTWLDAFDGTVNRAQKGMHLQYHSDHTTLGYAIDSLFDTLGGCFICLSIFFYLVKKFGSSNFQLPFVSPCNVSVKSDTSTFSQGQTNKETYYMKKMLWKSLTFGVCLGVAGKCWDQAVEDFTNVFQVEVTGDQLKRLQFELCHSHMTLIIFCLWRLFGGQSVLNYILVAFYMDRVWEFLQYMQYILLAVAALLYIVTAVYIHHIRSVLHL